MKVLQGRNYGSIPHLLNSKLGEHDKYIHKGQDAIIRNGGRDRHDLVHVSLKVDGTNVGVLRRGEKLIAVQRHGFDCSSSPREQHHKFCEFVEENRQQFFQLLNDGDRIVGEWLYQASGIIYDIKCDPFLPFDIFKADGRRMQWNEMVLHVSANSRFEPPPSISYGFKEGQPTQYPTLLELSKHSKVTPISCHNHEGLVYRVERKGVFDYMAKWVIDSFVPGKFLPGVGGNEDEAITLNNMYIKTE